MSKGIVKFLTTCKAFGGSERSTVMLQRMFLEEGYQVELYPFEGFIRDDYRSNIPEGVIVKDLIDASISEPCTFFVFYTSDTIYNPLFNTPQFETVMGHIQADKKIMVLNYHLGECGKLEWTKQFDLYLFLNAGREDEFLSIFDAEKTLALPPPVDLSEFYKIQPVFDQKFNFARVNSQGDGKYPTTFNLLIQRMLAERKDLFLYFMPPKSDLIQHPRILSYPNNSMDVFKFLSLANCFWYILPTEYTEQGPRVILEAQAAGLPVIGSNQSGVMYRVNKDTGWLINNPFDILEILKDLTMDELRQKGNNAREYAYANYNPKQWIDTIVSA